MYTNTWTGTGIGVAILDTGLYPHIDFGERIRGFQDFLGHRPYPYDDSGHGTHVAEIEKLETRDGEIDEEMAQPEVAVNVAECVRLSKEKAAIAEKLEELYAKWEELA